MKILILGGGASGLYSAIFLKLSHHEDDVTVLEKEEKIGRKLYATGNGHCNLLPLELNESKYNCPSYVKPYIERFPLPKLINALENIGIEVFASDYGYYPLSYNASTFVSLLTLAAKNLGVHIVTGFRAYDYENKNGSIKVLGTTGNYIGDRLIIASGGCSTPNLGSDGSVLEILAKHGYKIQKPLPGLSPLKVKMPNVIKPLSGIRHEAKFILYALESSKKIELHRELGELLYKDDGLSGIAIFNLSSLIQRFRDNRRYLIDIDLFPNEQNLQDKLARIYSFAPSYFMDSFLSKPLGAEVLRQSHLANTTLSKNHLGSIASAMHSLEYEYDSSYPFASSQVTIGGVERDEVDESFVSKKERNISIIGESLDVDGLCGGYNLAWSLISALVAGGIKI